MFNLLPPSYCSHRRCLAERPSVRCAYAAGGTAARNSRRAAPGKTQHSGPPRLKLHAGIVYLRERYLYRYGTRILRRFVFYLLGVIIFPTPPSFHPHCRTLLLLLLLFVIALFRPSVFIVIPRICSHPAFIRGVVRDDDGCRARCRGNIGSLFNPCFQLRRDLISAPDRQTDVKRGPEGVGVGSGCLLDE